MTTRSPSTIAYELRRLSALGGPIAITQIGVMSLGVVDMAMVGGLGVHELDAAALGGLWTFGTLIFGMGLLFGVDPIITQAFGARDGQRAGLALQQSIVLSLAASVPMALAWLVTEPVMLLFDQDPALAAAADSYVAIQLPSIPAFLIFIALRQYVQGRGIVLPALLAVFVANGFNVLANWVLIYGKLGVPAMGLDGAGLATSATRVFQMLAMLLLIWRGRLYRGAWTPWSLAAFDRRGLGRICWFGVPVAIQYGLESWAFQIMVLMSGWIGETQLAAQSIVLNLAALAFMLPLGVSIGATTRVGNLIGEGRHHDAQRAAYVSLFLGAATMVLSALVFVSLRWVLPGVYTDNAEVVAMAAACLPIAAAFQLFDGLQVVGGGILRGMGNTVPAAIFNLIGYYGLALPLAYWLAIVHEWGLSGLWWGMAAGLFVVASALVLWLLRRGPAWLGERERLAGTARS